MGFKMWVLGNLTVQLSIFLCHLPRTGTLWQPPTRAAQKGCFLAIFALYWVFLRDSEEIPVWESSPNMPLTLYHQRGVWAAAERLKACFKHNFWAWMSCCVWVFHIFSHASRMVLGKGCFSVCWLLIHHFGSDLNTSKWPILWFMTKPF